MQEDRRQDALKRLSYIEGHVAGIRKMVAEDKYCIDILRQTHAVDSHSYCRGPFGSFAELVSRRPEGK